MDLCRRKEEEGLREPLITTNLSLPRRRESRDAKRFWIPAFAGMTFLEVTLNKNNLPIRGDGAKI